MLAEIAHVLKLRIVTPAVNQDTSVRIARSQCSCILVGQMKQSDQAALIAAGESHIVSDFPEESR
ncbi:hypothetical protein PSTT_13659 [Puccinia striiformis]|uniref:Uncharacterized protein n=1 Tax=Puccinia striiformis TaxID=27350 RepID=A0A2S4UQY0_9BASI|nr:hypothetical protein PSTT_13659 [Puccinia striiformis]